MMVCNHFINLVYVHNFGFRIYTTSSEYDMYNSFIIIIKHMSYKVPKYTIKQANIQYVPTFRTDAVLNINELTDDM